MRAEDLTGAEILPTRYIDLQAEDTPVGEAIIPIMKYIGTSALASFGLSTSRTFDLTEFMGF